jgi:hypothetical protein
MAVLLSSRTWFSRPERSQPERTRREDRHSKFYEISDNLGEYDRQVISHTSDANLLSDPGKKTRTVSTQRTRVLSPGEIAGIPAGRALHLDGTRWELLTLTAAHRDEPWRTLTTPAGS